MSTESGQTLALLGYALAQAGVPFLHLAPAPGDGAQALKINPNEPRWAAANDPQGDDNEVDH